MNELTVIIPVYNVESVLKRCLDSIVNQELENFKVILVDDGSTDSSLKICQEYAVKDPRFFVVSQENIGLSGARNTGIALAQSKYLMFIDSDDYVEKDFLKVAYESITKYNADLCIMGYTRVNSEKKCTFFVKNSQDGVISKDKALLEITNNSYAWDKIYKSTLFENIKFPLGKLFEDAYVQHLIVDKADKIIYVPNYSYQYVTRDGSIITQMSEQSVADQFESLNGQYIFFQHKYPQIAPKIEKKVLIRALRYFTYCSKDYNQKLYCEALKLIRKTNISPSDIDDKKFKVALRLFKISPSIAVAMFKFRKFVIMKYSK